MKSMRTKSIKTHSATHFAGPAVLAVLAVVLLLSWAPNVEAQTQSQPTSAARSASATDANAGHSSAATSGTNAAATNSSDESEIPPAIARQLAALRAEIEALKAELHNQRIAAAAAAVPAPPTPTPVPATPSVAATAPAATANPSPSVKGAAPAPAPAPEIKAETTSAAPAGGASQTATASSSKPHPSEPFAYADWTWLNGTSRVKDLPFDSKFFTPEIRLDTDYISSFNHPKDDSLGGSTEIFRSNEFQVEQISFGGDFHWENVRGRILTLGGMFGVTTPRNDASVGRGQWDLRGAYRYFGEAYGGYHFNVNHGLNVDAGIFVSYIGLFSYWNFDNWAYQPSYVSSNTPWFFNGLRIQWFPTDKLKIEPWIINGWQSYARYGTKPGLGGQILYRPKPWLSLVFNNYGMGEDTLWTGNVPIGRSRIHTDDSVEVKYYDHPERLLDRMAFSLTGDLGCEYGGGVSCHRNEPLVGVKGGPKQSFAGWMLYNRWWFDHDKFGLTIGGGAFDNPGRYLTLLPPINGADAVSGSPYFPESSGLPFKAWDTSITWDYMPKQYITFRWEYGYRHAAFPYFSGRGGITPPGGNNGQPGQFVCMDNTPAGTALTPGSCVNDGGVWFPDLRKDEPSLRLAIMVMF
jgi:hypothetical protein